jgi:predicted nucleic acid-binding protein
VIVADASAVVALLLGDRETHARVRAELAALAPIEAPDLITLEVLSAVTRIGRARRFARAEIGAVLGAYDRLPIHRHQTHPFWPRIAGLASWHSVYDAAYVVLAEALDAPLITADRRLARGITSVDVILV